MTERRDAVDIAKNARVLEWLRAELVGSAARVMRGMLRGDETATVDALADAAVVAYVLARRIGVPFASFENRMLARLRASVEAGHEVEAWYGDLSSLLAYLEQARGLPE